MSRTRALGSLLGLALLTGCGLTDQGGSAAPAAPTTTSSVRSPSASPTKFEPTRDDFQRVGEVLRTRAQAVRAHDERAFLATVDPQQPALVASQRTLYENLAQLPIASLSYSVDPTSALVPAKVPGTDPLLHPVVV